MEDSMASEMDMGPIRPQSFLFACELKAAKEFKFNPDENGCEHQLSLRTVCVDGSTKDELHVVEVEGLNAEGEQIKATLAALKPSVHPTVSLGGFEITPPVVFRLKKGSGPVHISGQHLVALDNDMSSDEDDEDEEEMEDYKTAIKRPANMQATKTIQKKMKLEEEEDEDEEDDDDDVDYDEEDDDDDEEEEDDDDEETPAKTKPPQKTPTKGALKENGKLSKPSTPAQKQEPKTPDGKGKQGPKTKTPKSPKGPMSVSAIKEKMQSTFKMASRGCKHPADAFCYVCGQFIKTRAKKYSVEASAKMCEAYKAYFGIPVGDQDKPWAPHFTCEHCKKTLEGWYRGEKRAMKFAIPRIWRKPTDHSSNCYFCMVDPSKRRTGKNAPAFTYPDLPSSISPVPHCHELPVPTPPEREQQSLEESSKSESEEDIIDPDDNFRGGAEERNPYYPNQKDLNDLIRDLGLTKSNAELLTSRLKQWNLLDESVQVADPVFPGSSH